MGSRIVSKSGSCVLMGALNLIVCGLSSFFVIMFIRLSFQYRNSSAGYMHVGDDTMANLGPLSMIAVVLLTAIFYVCLCAMRSSICSKVLNFIYKKRVLFGLLFIVLATLFELSGSSIACMATYLGESARGVIIGIPRSIRSDEWGVFTPFAFSQEYNGFASASALLGGGSTDVTMIYAQPCWAFPTLFRPFLWGYLVLGSTKGLAFFWSSRLVCLFLTSELFARDFFGHGRKVSVSFALMVTFAGVVQWWFAVNGIAELFIYGQLLVVCFGRLLGEKPIHGHCALLISLLIYWLCVAFVLVLYPAWQVPLFWIFFVLGLSHVVEFMRAGHCLLDLLNRLRLLLIALPLVVLSIVLAFVPVLNIVKIVEETAYPGSRFSFGGGLVLNQLGNWARSIFSPLAASAQSLAGVSNVCEGSSFFTPAPLGCVCALAVCLKSRLFGTRIDPAVVALAGLEIVFTTYCLFGLPQGISSLTLLSHSTEGRTWQMTGYLDLILLLRCAANGRNLFSEGRDDLRRCGLIFFTLFICLLWSFSAQNVCLLFVIGAAGAMFCFLVSLALLYFRANGAELCFLSVAIFVAVSGVCVNPLQQGAYSLTKGPVATTVKQVNKTDDIWIADSSILGNLCVAEGASCINSVNTYPRFEIWHLIDPMGEYEDVYNRYAHIAAIPDNDETTFELTFADSFTLHITLDDARRIGVTKWITAYDLNEFDTDSTKAIYICSVGRYKVYELKGAK